MSKNRIRFYISLAIVLAVFLVIVFAAPFEHNTVFWLSFVFALVAVAVQLYAYPKAFDFEGREVRSKFYGFPLAKLATIYLVVQLLLSLLLMLLAKYAAIPTWVVVILYAVVLGAALFGLNTVDSIRDEVERQDKVHAADVRTMRDFQSKAAYVASQCEDEKTKQALDKLAEALRFSDPVSGEALRAVEMNLGSLLDLLQSAVLEKDYVSAAALCARAEATLAERNRLCKLNK